MSVELIIRYALDPYPLPTNALSDLSLLHFEYQDGMKAGALSPTIGINLLTGAIQNPEVFEAKGYENWLRRLQTNSYGVQEKATVRCTLKVIHKKRLLTYTYKGPAVPLFSPLYNSKAHEDLPVDELRWVLGPDYGKIKYTINDMYMPLSFFDWVFLLSLPTMTTTLQDDPYFQRFVDEVSLGCMSCYNEFYYPPSTPDSSFSTWWKASKAYLRGLSDYDSETVMQYQRASQLINLFVSSSREDIQSYRYLDVMKPLHVDRARTAVQVQYNRLYPSYVSNPSIYPHTYFPTLGAPIPISEIRPGQENPAIWITACLDLMQRDLRRIIAGAPPTTTQFIVYRGLTKPFGTTSGVARHYAGFLSTSGDYNMSNLYFRGPYGNLLCITVPPGQQCLLLGAYKIQTECEVLFAPRTQLQIDRYDSSRSSIFQGKNPLFVTITPETSLVGVKRERE